MTDAGTPTDGGADTSTPDAPDSGSGETVSFVITNSADETPIAGAVVGLDAADGTRLEETSGADGRVTFDGVVVGADPGWVTAVAEGFVVLSTHLTTTTLAAWRAIDDRMPLVAQAPTPNLVTITGTISNVTSATNNFTVAADAPASINYQDVGPDFEFEVPVDTPFTITATEWSATFTSTTVEQTFYGTAVVASDGFSADGTLDVDLSITAAYSMATGTLPLAPEGHTLEGVLPYALVRDSPPIANAVYGGPTSFAVNAEMTAWDFAMTWIEPASAHEPLTTDYLNRPPNFAVTTIAGYPTAGAVDLAWLDPPEVVVPAFGASQGLHDPVRYESGDVDAEFVLDVVDDATGAAFWLAVAEEGTREFALPELPASVDEADVLPPGPLVGRVRACDLGTGDRAYCQRSAGGRTFDWSR